jgi:queuine tRNA-ribosyltransferase
VQGGIDEQLRRRSARQIVNEGFDGYGIGGLSVGETLAEMLPALAATLDELPVDQPRYLMGVGDPVSLVEAVGLGVDQFDCVLQTRLGRHGTALTSGGRVNLRNATHRTSDDPIDAGCACPVCARHSRGYLRHLLSVGEPSASRLVSMHNLAWTYRLMDTMREAIAVENFSGLRAEILAVWGTR